MEGETDLKTLLGRAKEIAKFYGATKGRTNFQAKMAWMSAKLYNAPSRQEREDIHKQLVEVFVQALQMAHHISNEDMFLREVLNRLDWQEEAVKKELLALARSK